MINLRDYQTEAIAAIRADLQTADRTLAVMATGTGKTVVFLALLDALRESGELTRALIIAHRRELIYQPIDRAAAMFKELSADMGIVMAGRNDIGARHIVATVQTLASDKRLAQLLSTGAFSHIVIDEAHHATADTYTNLIAKFPGAKIIGFTATPLRSDGDGLSKVFQRVAYRLPISAAIRRGALVTFDALGVQLPISLAGIKETEDGWEREALGDLLLAENVKEIVLKKWTEYAGNRQTIAFTASVAQARETSEYFKAQGVKAEWVSGETPDHERADILGRYQRGDTQIVFNCMVLTEGFDAPETAAVLMIAPTKSDLIYVQRLGRGLRTSPGKTDCRVLDFAPIEDRNVVMAGDVLGKPRAVKKAEDQAARQGVLFSISVDRLGEAASIDPHSLIVKTLNLLKKDALAWTFDGVYATAALSEKETLCIVLPDAQRVLKAETLQRGGDWRPPHDRLLQFIKSFRLYHVNGRASFVGQYGTLDEAKGHADDLALDHLDHVLSKKSAHWRHDEASDKQRAMLKQLGVTHEVTTKGQAAQWITHAMTCQQASRIDRAKAADMLR